MLDQPQPLYADDPINLVRLRAFLQETAPAIGKIWNVSQFAGGFSNLTYCLHTAEKDYVLRRPPQGAAIQSAHDMAREFRVLTLLQGHYRPVPVPVLYCEKTGGDRCAVLPHGTFAGRHPAAIEYATNESCPRIAPPDCLQSGG